MIQRLRQRDKLKRAARWLLVVFVMAWTNLVFQAPAHAAMKLDRMQAKAAGVMSCHCPPPICDTVLSHASDRSIDGIQQINLDALAFNGVIISIIKIDSIDYSSATELPFFELQFRETSPPPLLLKTVLII